jgi:hypothetical protein
MATLLETDGEVYSKWPKNSKTFTEQELIELVGGYFTLYRLRSVGAIIGRADGQALPHNETASKLLRPHLIFMDGGIRGPMLVTTYTEVRGIPASKKARKLRY